MLKKLLTNIYKVFICFEEADENCEEFVNYNECSECSLNYYLDEDFICQPNPISRIQNCQKYEDFDNCLECENTYYLYSSNECRSVNQIEFCEEYDGKQSFSSCKRCQLGFFSQNSKCVIRTKSQNIQNCQKFQYDDDKCEICNENYLVSLDGLKCLNTIPNCEISQQNNNQYQCTKCISEFFLQNGSQCVKGKIDFCDVYLKEQICQKCLNGYYLSENKCLLHDQILLCDRYNLTQANTCEYCSENSFLFNINSICIEQEQIDYCENYSQTNPIFCIKCEIGYYLDEDKICQIIPIKNCTEYDINLEKCTGCGKNYVLSIDFTKCLTILDHQSLNCEENTQQFEVNKNQITTSYCKVCQSNFQFIDHTNHFACIDIEDLNDLDITLQEEKSFCLKYNSQGYCLQCIENKFLEDGKCVNECSKKIYKLQDYQIQTSGQIKSIMITGQKQCFDDVNQDFENAEILGIDLSDQTFVQTFEIIIKCQENQFPVLKFPTKYKEEQFALYNRFHNQDINQPFDKITKTPVQIFPAIYQCLIPPKKTIKINGVQTQQVISPQVPNCEYYHYFDINFEAYRCIKCKFGFVSKIKIEDGDSFLEQCISYTKCKDKKLSGLDLQWERVLSCHVCKDSKEIPFLAMQMISTSYPFPLKYRQYTLTGINHLKNPNSDLFSINCMQDTPGNLGYDTSDPDENLYKYQKLPDNCALGIINLSITNGESRDNQKQIPDDNTTKKLSHFCGACRPGYQLTPLNNIFKHIAIKCTLIENCVGLEWLNYCSQCKQGYVYYSSITGPINFARCIKQKDLNCYASDNENKCHFCKQGYFLNKDFHCEEILPAYCESSKYFTQFKYYPPQLYNYALYINFMGVGCNKCESDHVALEVNRQKMNPFVCSESSYFRENSQNLKDSFYVANCKNYGLNKNLNIICEICQESYTNNLTKDKCFQVIPGCEIANDNESCYKCQRDRYIVNNKCSSQGVQFCEIPENFENSTIAKCQKCLKNYFLDQQYQCLPGNVENCDLFEYNNPNKCQQCIEGYSLLKNSPLDVCFEIPEQTNCKSASLKSISQNLSEFECKECLNNYSIITRDSKQIEQKSICLKFQKIDQCITYETQQNSITFLCQECEKEYFLRTDKKKCLSRTNFNKNCLEFNKNEDSCLNCSEDFFIYNSNCTSNPKGVPNCLIFYNENTCKICQQGFYVQNNECVQLPTEQQIKNCQLYSSIDQCYFCQNSYILIDNTCELIEAKNCKTYISGKQCESCEENNVLITKEEIINCEINVKQNCLEISDQGPNYNCIQCIQNFYPDSEGNCQKANIIISNCKSYQTSDECQICNKGYAVSKDRKFCTPVQRITKNYDLNCLDYEQKISCSICDPGYILQQERCIRCQDQNCFYCNSIDKKCLICKPGTYMNNKKECIGKDIPTPNLLSEMIMKTTIFYILWMQQILKIFILKKNYFFKAINFDKILNQIIMKNTVVNTALSLKQPETHADYIRNKLKAKNTKCIDFFKNKFIYQKDGKLMNNISKKVFKDGSIYHGTFDGKSRSGKGILEYKNSDQYIGDWSNDKVHGKGMYIFSNGERYEGELVAGKKQGYGKYLYENGNIYEGQWLDDKKHGLGKYTYALSGESYNGNWVNGKKDGKGTFVFSTGDQYDGNFSDGKKSGNGNISYKNGGNFVGNWVNDQASGSGELTYQNGDKFVGNFSSSKKNGKGAYVMRNGGDYDGNFMDDNFNGQGQLRYQNGDHYEGYFKDGKKHGLGRYFFKNGDEYEGNWENNMKSGKGTYRYSDGSHYEGNWLNNLKSGMGKYVYRNGDSYTGNFENGLRSGLGKFMWKNGQVYDGSFKNGMMDGSGKLLDNTGNLLRQAKFMGGRLL